MKKERSLTINALLNVVKQICSIIFPMITFPFATRVLGAFNYGKINFSASLISYITLLAGLGITNYAIREGSRVKENKEKLQELTNELFSINLISMSVAYLLLFIIIVCWKKLDGYTTLLLIQSTAVLFTTIGTDWLNSIYEDYMFITIRYIICQILSMTFMLLLVRNSEDYLIYSFATVLGIILANIANMFYIRKTYKIYPKFVFRCGMKKHIKPIMVMFGTSVAAIIYVNSDITILGILKGEEEVGIYSVAAKIYTLVKQILNALLVVAIPRISSEIMNKTKEEVHKHLETLLNEILLIIVPACIGLAILAKPIILVFSGEEYVRASQSLQILSLALVFATLVTFYVYVILIPYKKEKIALISTVISALINVALNFIIIPYFGAIAAAVTTVISEFITTIISYYYAKRIVDINVKKSSIVGILNGIVTAIMCLIFIHLDYGNAVTIILSIICSIGSCGIIVLIMYKGIWRGQAPMW